MLPLAPLPPSTASSDVQQHSHFDLFIVDAFAPAPFMGNPAGVVMIPPGRAVPESYLQAVAAELKHAETAFLTPRPAAGHFDLRWFTPAAEVDLCGHATLASAHAVWQHSPSAPETLTFHTRSGPLTCKRIHGKIEMDFPALSITPEDPAPGLLHALALSPSQITFSGKTPFDLLLELASPDLVKTLAPDLALLASFEVRGIIVTAANPVAANFHVVSRFFAPRVGVPEDPATGSAHCAIAPHFRQRLGDHLRCFQASPRTAVLETLCAGDRVLLRGNAHTISSGQIIAP